MHRPACATPGCRRTPTAGWCDTHRDHGPLPAALPADLPISYRQLDHWARRGYIRPVRARWGSGVDRHWPPIEITIIRAMCRLVNAGLKLDVAARVAREAAESETPHPVVSLRDGVWLAFTTDTTTPTPKVPAQTR